MTLTIKGAGFYFNREFTLTTQQTSSPSVDIYTNEDACGSAEISVSDGCSAATTSLRATAGKWTTVSTDEVSHLENMVGEKKSCQYRECTYVLYSGAYKITENQAPASTPGGCCNAKQHYTSALVTKSGKYAQYFDPDVYYNLSCSDACQITQNPSHKDQRALIEDFYTWQFPNIPQHPNHPFLYPSVVEDLEDYSSSAFKEHSLWVSIYGNSLSYIRCSYNSGAPDGTAYVLSSYVTVFRVLHPVSTGLKAQKWTCGF